MGLTALQVEKEISPEDLMTPWQELPRGSDYRMAMMKRGLYTSPRLLWGIAKALALHPRATASLLHCYFIEQARDWQFRGENPPTTLLRQTWKINGG